MKDSKAPYGKKQKTNAAFKTDLGLAYSGISAAGDNSAENTVGCIKKVMRRMGNLGRTRSTGLQKNVQAMASAALHRQCGFDRVLAALREYRLDCSNGTVQMAPKDAFLHDKCKWILD